MATYRNHLPQTDGDRVFLSDGGMETTLIYHAGLDLPAFASFPLLDTEAGRDMLRDYYRPYVELAVANRLGFILETPTWRANPEWGAGLGYGGVDLDRINRDAVALMRQVRKANETPWSPMPVSGNIGPRGDGYRPERLMTVAEAEAYHAPQVRAFRGAGVDLVTAMTINYAEEGAGIARAAADAEVPVVISLTVETDGRLATGQPLEEAITAIDAASEGAPAYYMVNCAHPTHFEQALARGEEWVERIHGVRANASAKSHAELDESDTLDIGDMADLSRRYRALTRTFPSMRVLGGCCGTDHRHLAAICEACVPVSAAA